ncbi:hypothetical protein BsWGS_27869 [Bradybaena similaris]
MSAPDLTSIPLPAGPGSAMTVKKSAEDSRQTVHKDHAAVSRKEPAASSGDAPNKLTTPTGSIITAAGLDGKESSQRIVDQLFKDFIAQKITITSRVSKDTRDKKMVSRVRNSADEISKLLDMEIKSIKSSTENKDKLIDRKDQRPHSSSKQSKFIPVSSLVKEDKRIYDNVLPLNSDPISLSLQAQRSVSSSESEVDAINSQSIVQVNTLVATTTAETVCTMTAMSVNTTTVLTSTTQSKDSLQPHTGVSMVNDTSQTQTSTSMINYSSHPQTGTSMVNSSSQPQTSTSVVKRNVMLPMSLAKKMMQPKVLGVKLSSKSLSLITSKDRIDRDGRLWEEGEVCSSGSEGSEKDKASDSDGDGIPSDSGSIHSNSEDTKLHSSKHKKKHKHRHKKKSKKKSSKEKDMEKGNRRSKERDEKDKEKRKTHNKSDSRNSKDKDDKKVEKDQTKENGEKHSRDKHRSSDQEHEESKRKEKDSDKKRERSHSRSRSPKRHRKSKSRTHSRSKSPKKHRSHSKSPKRHKSHSRSKSPKRHRSHSRSSSPQSHGSGRYDEWDARRYSDDPSRYRSRSRSRSKKRHRRSRDGSKSRDRDRSKESQDRDLRVKIDKSKLRKIAIANALQNMKAGQGPQLDLTVVKSGGKSVEELTEFCKRISEKSKVDDVNVDSSDEEAVKKSDDEDMLIHHPFKVKEPNSTGIVMNIRNAKQLPILTPSEKQVQQATLRLTFPVSSGSHHRASESEWVPVVQPSPTTPAPPQAPAVAQIASVAEPQVTQNSGNSIFPDVSEAQKIDIGAIISERLQAVRKLQQNPFDMQALSKMHQVQQQASKWAASRHLPGQFVGSTGAHVLTQEQLIGDRRHQAWAKKTQLSHAAPVNGGIGMFLLQKMGWKQGEGLGKNNEGSKVPLMLDIKVDRRGLTTAAENPRHRPQGPSAAPRPAPRAKDLSNKHPVSGLMELCNRRKWGAPEFTVVSESGPDHKKNFLFKVKVNNVEYQPTSPSSNKKTAKALCAAICLQEMGLLPRDAPLNI